MRDVLRTTSRLFSVIGVIIRLPFVLPLWAQIPSSSSTGVPSITAAASASGFGNIGPAAPGSWIEIYGTNLATERRSWGPSDFNGANAPTSLDGVSVTIGGYAAFVSYISPTQINALLPSNVPIGSLPITVANANGTSPPISIAVSDYGARPLDPLDLQHWRHTVCRCCFPRLQDYVLPEGAIAGIPSRPASPGDTIIFFGIGFGSVTPNVPAGQIVSQSTLLNSPVQMLFGQTAVTPTFAGLSPNETGLYQFNVQVPSGSASGAVPLSFGLGGAPVPQTQGLSIALTQAPRLQITGLRDLSGAAGVAVPGSMVVVQGSGFAQNSATAQYPLPTVLAGISANFNGFAAPIVSVKPQEVEVQVPWEMLGNSKATLTLTNSETGFNSSMPVTLQTAAPAVPSGATGFSIQIEGSGGASPAPVSSGSKNRPVLPGEFLDIPAVGLGIQKDGPGDGQPATAANPGNSLRGVMVSIGSAWVPVLSAALIPGQTGVSSIRVQVPINAPVGNTVPLVINAWDRASSPISIAVAASPNPAFSINPADGALGLTPSVSYSISLVSDSITSDQVIWTDQPMNTPMVGPVPPGSFSLTEAGLSYSGPYSPLPEYMLLLATLKTDPTIFATARVLVTEGPARFHITPRNVVIGPSESINFQALDNNGNPVMVSWYINGSGGNPYSNVFQTEPDAIDANPATVRAVSGSGVTNGGSADQTLVFVIPSAPHIISLSPPNPGAGDTAVITTEGLDIRNVTVYFSRLDGSRIAVPATNSNNAIPVRIPPMQWRALLRLAPNLSTQRWSPRLRSRPPSLRSSDCVLNRSKLLKGRAPRLMSLSSSTPARDHSNGAARSVQLTKPASSVLRLR